MEDIRILGIALDEEIKVIEYSYRKTEGRESITLTSKEPARPELGRCYRDLEKMIHDELLLREKQFYLRKVKFSWESEASCQLNGYPYLKFMKVIGSVEERGRARMSVAAKLERKIWGLAKVVNKVASDDNEQNITFKELDEQILRLCDEAKKYINGERAQAELQFEAGDEYEQA